MSETTVEEIRVEVIKDAEKLIIEGIKKRQLPIGFVESEADFYAGYFIDKDGRIWPMGYAMDKAFEIISKKKENNKELSLELSDLSLDVLARLLTINNDEFTHIDSDELSTDQKNWLKYLNELKGEVKQ